MFSADDAPVWAYLASTLVGSVVFLLRQAQTSRQTDERLARLEKTLLNRLDDIERQLIESQSAEEPRRRFRLVSSRDG